MDCASGQPASEDAEREEAMREVFVIWGGIVALNLIHALVFSRGYFEANRRLLRLKFNEPEVSPRLARGYSVLNGIIAIAAFPLYWALAISCHRRFHGDWVRWAENEPTRNK